MNPETQQTSHTAPASPVTTTPEDRLAPQVTPGEIHESDKALLQQGVKQDELRAMQEGIINPPRSVQKGMQPRYHDWPTSVPGPRSTTPPQGTRPFNAIRPEQMVEVGYNQVTGEPASTDPHRSLPDNAQGPAGTDQPTAQDSIKRGKVRLE